MIAAVRALALFLTLCVLVAMAAVKLTRRAVRRRARGGLPEDGPPLSPCMSDRWYALVARYYEATASERVYPGARKQWWKRRHLGAVVVAGPGRPAGRRP
jgi:hypothetical protein